MMFIILASTLPFLWFKQELERHKSEWVRTEADLKERCEKYREKAAEMQDLAEKLDVSL